MSVYKRSISGTIFDTFNTLFILILALVCIYPFLYVLNITISAAGSYAQYGLNLIPKGFTLQYYRQIFGTSALAQDSFNSVIRTAAGTFGMVLFTILGAYPLSKKRFPNRNLWTLLVIIPMFFDGGLIPNYFLVKGLGLLNTRWSLILPGLVNPFYLIIMRNFMMSIPESLEESAKIDGASDMRVLWSIIFPLCKPIVATVALWSAVIHWNSWFDCMIYINDESKQVLQVLLFHIIALGNMRLVSGQLGSDQPYPLVIQSCTLIVTILPIILVYPFVQKYFVKGIMIGAVKG